MFLELFIAAAALCVGQAIFGQFEERVPPWHKVLKVIILLGVTALLSWTLGRAWALGFVAALAAAGLSFHVWWTRRHGIGVWIPRPRDRYYALRGWEYPG